jgi:hypothetical protein
MDNCFGKVYVVAREILEESEIVELEKYCACSTCKFPNFLPIWCYAHIRPVVENDFNIDVLKESRESRKLGKINMNTKTKWMTTPLYFLILLLLIFYMLRVKTNKFYFYI